MSSAPSGMKPAGTVSARRCHRNLLEEAPSEAAVTNDLRMAAYGQGADAMRVVGFQTLNGLAANCWHVIEGTAEIYTR